MKNTSNSVNSSSSNVAHQPDESNGGFNAAMAAQGLSRQPNTTGTQFPSLSPVGQRLADVFRVSPDEGVRSTKPSFVLPRAGAPVIPVAVANVLRRQWDLETYLTHCPLPQAGKEFVHLSDLRPSRNPGGKFSNTARIPSSKTGQTVGTESDSLEDPAQRMLEHADEVLYYLEQAAELPKHLFPEGHRRGKPYTADFVVFTVFGIVLLECMTRKEVASLAITASARYVRNELGGFSSPPVEEAAGKLGFRYMIVTEDNFDDRLLENFRRLTAYYRSELAVPVSNDEWNAIRETVLSEPGIVMSRLPIDNPQRRADLVYSLIAHGRLFTHLSKVDLKRPETVRLYLTKTEEGAFEIFFGRTRTARVTALPLANLLAQGKTFKLGREEYKVLRHTPSGVEVLNERASTTQVIDYRTLQESCPKLGQASDHLLPIWDQVAALSEPRLEEFLRRYQMIRPYLPGGTFEGEACHDRTTRYYLGEFRREKEESGFGERALIPGIRGNPESSVSDASLAILKDLIDEAFLQADAAPTAKYIFGLYYSKCKQKGFPDDDILVYESVARRIRALSKYEKALLRFGRRAAIKHRVPYGPRVLRRSPHGFGSWALAHIDHTLLDLLVEDPDSPGTFVRPWISAIVDSYDGRILAALVWFGNPCAKVVLDLLKECIARHATLPLEIRCDWGSEFRSRLLQTALARVGITLRYRKKGDPRSGSPVETSFSELNKRFIHNARGNTKALKNPRQTTADVLPENFQLYDAPRLRWLMNEYILAKNTAPRPCKPSPNDMCDAFLAQYGVHNAKWISAEVIERLHQIPVDGITRVVSDKGTIRVRSVDYAAQELTELVGKDVNVYDGRDPRHMFVDNPRTKQQVDCDALDPDVRGAGSAEEAEKIVSWRMKGAYIRRKAADRHWAGFAAKMRENEDRMIAERKVSVPKLELLPDPVSKTGFLTSDRIAAIEAAK